MKRLSLPSHPKDIVSKVTKLLPSARLREVIERRFGLKGKEPETLEAIGHSFDITRERVRQIEADALRHLARGGTAEIIAPIAASLHDHFRDHGEVCEESKLFQSVVEPRFHNHLNLILTVANPFRRVREDDSWHHRWFTNPEALKQAESIMARTAEELGGVKRPLAAQELFTILKNQAANTLGSVPKPEALESYLAISKLIKQNPYGEFGLVSWPTIRPRGVRDKAYAVLARIRKPLHFREVASAINKSGWAERKAHPQTVHNELIKDPRFVLVGRGLYALAEWGYRPGTVSDVIVSVLKRAAKPLAKEAILREVLAARFVKTNTILLNLQNRRLFRKAAEGYRLA